MVTPAAVARGIVTLQSAVKPPHLSRTGHSVQTEWDVLSTYIGDSSNLFARYECLQGLLISSPFCFTSRDGWL